MTNKRKPLSKKIRFEVFKRDKFTCQYCGRMSPDVILEVDHIEPISEGGTDDLINLTTSCRDCNRGKGKTKLSNVQTIKKQQQQLIDLAEKAEQARMVIEWKKELLSIRDEEIVAINDLIVSISGYELTNEDKQYMRNYLNQFPFQVVWDATEISFGQYFKGYGLEHAINNSFSFAIKKIGGICYNKIKGGDYDGDI